MKVIYEVNLKIDRKIKDDFRIWLTGHIQDVLAIEGFESANWFEVDEKDLNMVTWTVHYGLRDLKALNSYLENHAPRLRAPAKEKFGDMFQATRRTLELVKSY